MEPLKINLGVKKIKDIEFSINENIDVPTPVTANITFELSTHLNENENLVEMVLSATFTDQEKENILMKIKTSNIFFLLELQQLLDKETKQYNIPDNIMITMLSLSISHTRALLAKNTLGTKFSEIYIPILNPAELFNNLYNKH